MIRWFAVLLLAIFIVPPGAIAQSVADLERQIEQHNSQIEALNREIAQFEQQLAAVGRQKQSLQQRVNELDLSIKKTTASMNVTRAQISSTQLQIRQLSDGIATKEELMDSARAGVSESIRRLNDAESTPLALYVLGSEDISERWQDVDRNETLQAALSEQVDLLATQKKSLTDTKTAAEEKRAQLQKQQATLAAQQGTLNAQKKAQSELLAQTKQQESSYQAILRQKEAEKDAFEAVLFQLASRLEYTLDPSRIPPAGKGVLRWPLDNVFVTQEFGRTSSSGRLYASGSHDGMDFRAAIGTPVRSALTGTVVEVNHGAARNCQYGKWVLVKHGNGLTTLYAHLSDIVVSKGQPIGTGAVVGYSGDTGYATGPHLHFTVYQSDAVSFKSYTCKNGARVLVPIAPVQGYLNPRDYL